MKLVKKNKTTIEKLPAGSLFLFEETGTVAIKSEYRNERGSPECYIVGSGEMFWGGTKTAKEMNALQVVRLKLNKDQK